MKHLLAIHDAYRYMVRLQTRFVRAELADLGDKVTSNSQVSMEVSCLC